MNTKQLKMLLRTDIWKCIAILTEQLNSSSPRFHLFEISFILIFDNCKNKYYFFRLGDNSIMGDRRHKDEIDSGDDSDGKADDEVSVEKNDHEDHDVNL